MPFCVYCGKPITATAKFCENCGKPVSTPQAKKIQEIKDEILHQNEKTETIVSGVSNRSSSFVRSLESPPAAETVKMIVPDQVIVYGFGKAEIFNLIITTHRTIFVKLTNSIKEQAQKKMNDKVNGAKMNRVIKWMAKRVDYSAYLNWYADKTPQQALNETPGNYAIPNADIIDVTVNDNSFDSEEGGTVPDFELVITTKEKTLKLKSIINPDNVRGQSIDDAYKN